MIKKLLFTLSLVVLATSMSFAQVNSVGLIGPGSPTGGWDDDADLTQDAMNPDLWTANMDLTTGKVKFRANDEWTISWGGDGDVTFPAGVAVSPGNDIEAFAGNYDISINVVTGDYSFTNTSTVYSSIGIIGTATPNGWDEPDTDMVQDPNVPHIWTLEVTLTDGVMKFRAEDGWDFNWGNDNSDFPMGVGIQGQGDIMVPAGEYVISLNTDTGEYNFGGTIPVYTTIGLIGTGGPTGGWETDTDMVQDPNTPYIWTLDAVAITPGGVKFRAEDAWDVSWGADEWPNGTATTSGGNIPSQAGEYNITFNHLTGEYSFASTTPIYNSIGIIGTATPNGWSDPDTDMIQNPANPNEWNLQITLTDGLLKFRADDGWDVSWGNDNSDFPIGVATDPGGDIMVPAGEYKIQFNSATGDYNFAPPITLYNSIGIVGDGTTNGWAGPDIDMVQDPIIQDNWTAEVYLNGGAVKFRADDEWIVDWGSSSFPVGSGTQGGDNIPVPEGNYTVTLNSTSGFYTFTPVSIGMVGSATPGGWDVDTPMQGSGEVTNEWSIQIDLTEGGAAKFRKDGSWDVNWGGAANPAEFPNGIGVQDGSDIAIPTAGTYNVAFNTNTGAYSFASATSTSEVLNPNTVKLFPNPTTDVLNIQVDAEQLQGKVRILILDMNGKVLAAHQQNINNLIDLNVAQLNNGMYILQIANDDYLIGKRFSVVK